MLSAVVPLGTSNKLEPNGILSGAGVSEVPWPSKRRVEPKSSSEHCRPGALVTDGHGAVQWAGLDRKSQNLMQSTSDLTVPSPHRNARRMIPQVHLCSISLSLFNEAHAFHTPFCSCQLMCPFSASCLSSSWPPHFPNDFSETQGPGSAQFQFSASTYSGATTIPARVPPHLRESQTTPRKPSPTRVPPHLKTSIRTASQGMTSATPRDEGNVGSVGAEKSVSKNWSAFPSVVTHSISPTRGTKVPNIKCGISLDTSIVSSLKSTAMGSDTGAECGSTFSSRTGSVVSQRPTTAQSKVPPHLQTSLSTAPWEHGDLNPTNRAGCTGRTTKRIYERPKSAFVTGASTAPWGVDT